MATLAYSETFVVVFVVCHEVTYIWDNNITVVN